MQLENLSDVRQDIFFSKYVELGSGKSGSSLRIFFKITETNFVGNVVGGEEGQPRREKYSFMCKWIDHVFQV